MADDKVKDSTFTPLGGFTWKEIDETVRELSTWEAYGPNEPDGFYGLVCSAHDAARRILAARRERDQANVDHCAWTNLVKQNGVLIEERDKALAELATHCMQVEMKWALVEAKQKVQARRIAENERLRCLLEMWEAGKHDDSPLGAAPDSAFEILDGLWGTIENPAQVDAYARRRIAENERLRVALEAFEKEHECQEARLYGVRAHDAIKLAARLRAAIEAK